ncbi:MAG: ATP-binding protein [Saprospiraceae bacterium]|nr:ATP-binding protein [Saprospiraceae bacterium]
MQRDLYQALLQWKNASTRKPLILQGARQVGKTWLMKEFGKNEFEQVAYLNFESNARMQTIFAADFDIRRIVSIIEIEINQKIQPDKTLLIFDEIQEAEKGLTALKYFQELAPEYSIIAAGSLLGVSMQKNASFPVGKVDFLRMYPLSFREFLDALGQHLQKEHLEAQNWPVVGVFHDKLVELLRLYYFVGGMPEAVSTYAELGDLNAVRSIQEKILIGYENDFAKHAPNEVVPRIRLVWHALISQLAKDNRKFIYGQVKKGSRAKDFETAIHWLTDAGLVLKAHCIEKPALPLSAYLNMDAFKLFMLDVGLLNAVAKVEPAVLLEKNNILTEFKGAMTEQFVAQQLRIRYELYYWTTSAGNAEVDFVIQRRDDIIPIEVKAEENLKSKSLSVFVEKFKPRLAYRSSMSAYREQDWMTNVPLYGVNGL